MATEIIEEKTTHSMPDGMRTIKRQAVDATSADKQVYRKRRDVFRADQIVWYILAIIEILLGFRFLLELLGANAYSGFASFIYAISLPFEAPFRGVFGVSAAGSTIVEWSIFVAAAVYAVLAYIISRFLRIIYPVSQRELEPTE